MQILKTVSFLHQTGKKAALLQTSSRNRKPGGFWLPFSNNVTISHCTPTNNLPYLFKIYVIFMKPERIFYHYNLNISQLIIKDIRTSLKNVKEGGRLCL